MECEHLWTPFSEGAQEEQHHPETAGVPLSVLHREHTDSLYMCVVNQLHSILEDGASEGH